MDSEEMVAQCNKPVLRRLVSDGIVAVPLNVGQREALRRFMERIKSGEYTETPYPCLCGSKDDVVVACKDRYGIPLRTVLCTGCGLMRSDPYLSPVSLVSFYQNDYRSIYEHTDYLGLSSLARLIRQGECIYQFFREHNVKIPKHVFDVGCYTGFTLVYFLLQGHVVAGCDYETDYLEIGRKIGLDLHEGGLDTLPWILSTLRMCLCYRRARRLCRVLF